MDFKIQSSRPIWQQLTEQLRQRIVTGVYPPDPGSRRYGSWPRRRA